MSARRNFALALLFSLPFSAFCQSSAYPISTDRPSFSDATLIVPVGHPQIEIGFTATNFDSGHTLTLGEALVRFGLSDRLELRFINGTWAESTVGGKIEGYQDPAVGFKYLLVKGVYSGKARRPELSIEGLSSIPAGDAGFRVNRSQPTAKLIWAYSLDSATTLGGNFVVSDFGSSPNRFTQYAVSVYVSRTINARLGAFLEGYTLSPVSAGGTDSLFVDAGLTYLLSPRAQLDARVGSGTKPGGDGTYFGAGISYRF